MFGVLFCGVCCEYENYIIVVSYEKRQLTGPDKKRDLDQKV